MLSNLKRYVGPGVSANLPYYLILEDVFAPECWPYRLSMTTRKMHAYNKAGAMSFLFVRLDVTYKRDVCNFAVFRYLMRMDENNGVGACDTVADTLC